MIFSLGKFDLMSKEECVGQCQKGDYLGVSIGVCVKKVITEEICFSRSVETTFKVEEPGHENRE